MTKPFRCKDTNACKFGAEPCPTPSVCGVDCPSLKSIPLRKQLGEVIRFFTEPTCCTIQGIASCQQGRTCPVREGYKPSEAMHDIQEPKK